MSAVQSATSWHTRPVSAVAAEWKVDPVLGLSPEEAAQRLAQHGPNRLREGKRRSVLRMIIDQVADVMIIVLVIAAIVAGTVGAPEDAVAILAIVVLNGVLGFLQEYRADRAMRALQRMAAPNAHVRRGHVVMTVPAGDLVPGDVVLLEAGMIVPADLRLTGAWLVRMDESALTGESLPVEKSTVATVPEDAPLGDRRTMAFKGTVTTYGRGEGIVVATGMKTELGRVAALLDEADALRTPLQQRLQRFASQLAVGVVALCAAIFAIGLLRGEPPLLMFLTALSLAVAAMPEALPAVVTVSLALGARRMAARHALIRHLPAVETLGSVTYICADKTGTLTQNRMEVRAWRDSAPDVATTNAPPARILVEAMALNADATLGEEGRHRGDPTEVALVEFARLHGVDAAALARRHVRLGELPFSSERGRMTTMHDDGAGGVILLMKGAPERVAPCCRSPAAVAGESAAMGAAAMMSAANALANAGLRVMAFARRDVPKRTGPALTERTLTERTLTERTLTERTLTEQDERDFACIGLVGIADPLRPEAAAAVRECREAGIHVVMITGDHPATADAIARDLSIEAGDERTAFTGAALAQLDDEVLQQRVGKIRVYARVAPEQKIRIVRALQRRGEFVAMTGDGVNDAPALRQADIGIAMGRVGTDVAREAADMVLVDDNFATIVSAVREGRRIYDNIRKFIRYILTGNSAEIWLLFIAPLVALPLPLLPIHILWINLVTDGLPGLALAVERAERHIMQRPPRAPDESVFARGLWQHVLWVGLLMGGVALAAQAWGVRTGAHWQSMTFTVLALSQLGHALAVRSERESLFAQGVWSNPALALAVVATVALQLATLYVPALSRLFKTAPLTTRELIVCLALSSVVFVAVEIEKAMLRRGFRYGTNAS